MIGRNGKKLITETEKQIVLRHRGSVRSAAMAAGISYYSAWKIINEPTPKKVTKSKQKFFEHDPYYFN